MGVGCFGSSAVGGVRPVDLVSSIWRSANSEYLLHIGHSRSDEFRHRRSKIPTLEAEFLLNSWVEVEKVAM